MTDPIKLTDEVLAQLRHVIAISDDAIVVDGRDAGCVRIIAAIRELRDRAKAVCDESGCVGIVLSLTEGGS